MNSSASPWNDRINSVCALSLGAERPILCSTALQAILLCLILQALNAPLNQTGADDRRREPAPDALKRVSSGLYY